MTVRLASCSCGQLSAKVCGEPIRVAVCHCLACQRRTGSVFGAQARFARRDVELSGTATEYLRIGDAGGKARFMVCPACGSTVCYVLDGREDTVAIPVGAFADPSFAPPSFSVYEDRMHAWVVLPPGIEHMA